MNNKEPENAKNDILEFVSAIITNQEGKPLLLKRSENLKLDPGKFDMCSGHMKRGECPMQSMYRELREEVGITEQDIITMEHLANVATPHIKFPNTTTHIYHILISLPLEEINKRIEQTKDREMEYGQYLENIHELKEMQQKTSQIRVQYTEKMEKVYQLLEQKLKDRKGVRESRCEEK